MRREDRAEIQGFWRCGALAGGGRSRRVESGLRVGRRGSGWEPGVLWSPSGSANARWHLHRACSRNVPSGGTWLAQGHAWRPLLGHTAISS